MSSSHKPVVVRANEQPLYNGADGVSATVLIDAQTTDARNLALGHISFGAGKSVPPHTREVEEFIYVIEGTTVILACDEEYVLNAGDAIYIPSGTEHQHTNREESQTLKQIYIFAPPGPEKMVRDWPVVSG
jgi:quercetin dioxygenase-like cupin family protein